VGIAKIYAIAIHETDGLKTALDVELFAIFMGRGRLFRHNLPFFLIVDKELNCVFSIRSKRHTCF
jgi:hypothetical protein